MFPYNDNHFIAYLTLDTLMVIIASGSDVVVLPHLR